MARDNYDPWIEEWLMFYYMLILIPVLFLFHLGRILLFPLVLVLCCDWKESVDWLRRSAI